MKKCDIVTFGAVCSRAIKKQCGWLNPLMKGGEAMSTYEIIVIIFLAMTFIVALVKLMIYLVDKFSQRK